MTFRILTKLDCKKASEAIQLENDNSISGHSRLTVNPLTLKDLIIKPLVINDLA